MCSLSKTSTEKSFCRSSRARITSRIQNDAWPLSGDDRGESRGKSHIILGSIARSRAQLAAFTAEKQKLCFRKSVPPSLELYLSKDNTEHFPEPVLLYQSSLIHRWEGGQKSNHQLLLVTLFRFSVPSGVSKSHVTLSAAESTSLQPPAHSANANSKSGFIGLVSHLAFHSVPLSS